MARSSSRQRTVCGSCELPFYAEKGACPYCGDVASLDEPEPDGTGFVFGTAESAGDSRTTCPDCGLPYDDTDGCPYCAYASDGDASSSGAATAGEGTGVTEYVSGEGSSVQGREGDAGLVRRLKRALGF